MSSQSIINQDKLGRTPVRTFIKLILHGELSEIFRVFIQKVRTFFGLRLRVAAILRRRVSGLPIIGAWYQRKYLRDILAHYYHYKAPASGTKTLKLAIIAHHADTKPKSSTFIRLISPLTSKTAHQNISIKLYPENTVSLANKIDVCIIQRNVYDDISTAKELVTHLRANKVALVMDSDDGFGAIDDTHPEYGTYQRRLKAYNYLLQEADQIWFSTDSLAGAHKEHEGKIRTIPNSLDARIWGMKNVPILQEDTPLQFVYMGTATHNADLEMILPAFEYINECAPGSFELNIIGVSDNLPERTWVNALIQERGSMYPSFVEWFVENNAFDIGLSPLVESEFNKSKSDIKCLDYIAAGILPLVSDILPYGSRELDGFVLRVQNTQESWEAKLLELVTNKIITRKQAKISVARGQKYLWKNRSSELTASVLMAQLNSLKKK